MVNKITETLHSGRGQNRQAFDFTLYRKPAEFGGVHVDQFWMALPSVYGQRGKQSANHDRIIDYYWSRCLEGGTDAEDDVVESYILAKLLPQVRSNGSRRVFTDAIGTQPRRVGESKQALIAELEAQLHRARDQAMDGLTFNRITNGLLGAESFNAEASAFYIAFAKQLFERGREAIRQRGPSGLEVSALSWKQLMTSIGRRAEMADQKMALDVLSYECRAAMHRCYSATWFDLLKRLDQKYSLSVESVQYHRLMHFDIVFDLGNPHARFHLFHGHVFALHPAVGPFLQTKTGGELIGSYLREDPGPSASPRLLNGLVIAMNDYASRLELYRESRKKQPRSNVDIEESQDEAVHRSRRRRSKSLGDD